jgi:gamma-glutamylcyclotransferase (GGCT)/AIG2-like uncharacterized protein YtfP
MYLFVYGTLRFSESLIKQGELMNEFEFIGKGKMRAVMYDIGNYPGAAEDNSGNEIVGELFRMMNEKSALDRLDQYENYDRLNEKSGEYIRRKTSIRMNDGRSLMAWVYWYNGDLHSKKRILENDYFKYLAIKQPD